MEALSNSWLTELWSSERTTMVLKSFPGGVGAREAASMAVAHGTKVEIRTGESEILPHDSSSGWRQPSADLDRT